MKMINDEFIQKFKEHLINEEKSIFKLKESGMLIRFGCTKKLLDFIKIRKGHTNRVSLLFILGLFNISESSHCEVPEFSYAWNINFFVRRVWVTDSWTV